LSVSKYPVPIQNSIEAKQLEGSEFLSYGFIVFFIQSAFAPPCDLTWCVSPKVGDYLAGRIGKIISKRDQSNIRPASAGHSLQPRRPDNAVLEVPAPAERSKKRPKAASGNQSQETVAPKRQKKKVNPVSAKGGKRLKSSTKEPNIKPDGGTWGLLIALALHANDEARERNWMEKEVCCACVRLVAQCDVRTKH